MFFEKKDYEEATIEIISIENTDVICTSPPVIEVRPGGEGSGSQTSLN